MFGLRRVKGLGLLGCGLLLCGGLVVGCSESDAESAADHVDVETLVVRKFDTGTQTETDSPGSLDAPGSLGGTKEGSDGSKGGNAQGNDGVKKRGDGNKDKVDWKKGGLLDQLLGLTGDEGEVKLDVELVDGVVWVEKDGMRVRMKEDVGELGDEALKDLVLGEARFAKIKREDIRIVKAGDEAVKKRPRGPIEPLIINQDHELGFPSISLPKAPAVAGYLPVEFKKLASFKFDDQILTDDEGNDVPEKVNKQIPKWVHDLNGKKVGVVGYMLTIDFRQGKTNEFTLMPLSPNCRFCQSPPMNMMIEVKTKDGKRLTYNGDDPVLVLGTFEVGPQIITGTTVSIFRMTAVEVRELPKEALGSD